MYLTSELYHDVFFIHDEKVMSYKKGRPTKFKGNRIVVEEYKHPHNLSLDIWNYTKVR